MSVGQQVDLVFLRHFEGELVDAPMPTLQQKCFVKNFPKGKIKREMSLHSHLRVSQGRAGHDPQRHLQFDSQAWMLNRRVEGTDPRAATQELIRIRERNTHLSYTHRILLES